MFRVLFQFLPNHMMGNRGSQFYQGLAHAGIQMGILFLGLFGQRQQTGLMGGR